MIGINEPFMQSVPKDIITGFTKASPLCETRTGTVVGTPIAVNK